MQPQPYRPQLEVARLEHGGVQVVELDLNSVGELDAALAAASGAERPRVCLDMSHLGFIDSTGLMAMLSVVDDREAALEDLD